MAEKDPEFEELFRDPAEREVINLLLASKPADPKLDPYFRSYLRDRLMAEARRSLPTATRRSPWQGWTIRPLPAFAAMAAGFLVVVGALAYLHSQQAQPQQAIVVSAALANKTDVSVGQPITLTFSGPVDHTAVEESLVIQPATQYTTHWEGQTLVVIPIHQLAASTSYTVKLRPSPVAAPTRPAVNPTPAVPPVPVVVHFLTAPSPLPPVVQSSWTSQHITFLGDTVRLAEPGTFAAAQWTAEGQLVVTRPAAGAAATSSPTSASPSASPSGAATPAAQSSPTLAPAADLWLMDPDGNFVRKIASTTVGAAPAPVDGRFAFWRQASNGQYQLVVSSIAGGSQGELTIATLGHAPEGAPAWLGGSRLAYSDGGSLHVVDIQGNAVALPAPITAGGPIAGSPDGRLLAVQQATGILVYDLVHPDPVFTETGGTGFTWSSQDDLAFTIQQSGSTQVWVQPDEGGAAKLVHTPGIGETWSNLNWSPDGASLLATVQQVNPALGTISHLTVINADGSGLLQLSSNAYDNLAWSPKGDAVLFTRLDETGQAALWRASLRLGALSDADRAQQQALGVVKTFMDARLSGDQATAQTQLSAAALAGYQSGTPALLSPANPKYERWYPVTVQLVNPQSFLIGVRIVEASGSQEVAFFEERLTLNLHGQLWTIDAVDASPTVSLAAAGPSVVSVVVVPQEGPNQVVQVRFDSDLAQGAITPDSVYVKDDSGNAITPVSLTYNQDTHLATLTAKLHHGHTYTLVVTTAVTDINGHPLAQEYDSPLVISG